MAMRVLVVDDEADVRMTLARVLTRRGYACETVSGAKEALAKYSEQPFDVVLTDLGMPGVNGWELAEQLKIVAPEVRILLITGWPIQISPEQLRERGIETIISKPVDLKELLSALSQSSNDE
jgi:CheY-like chemotaxis protein